MPRTIPVNEHMDASGLIRKGVFGGIALFDGTLEDQVGHMDAAALRAKLEDSDEGVRQTVVVVLGNIATVVVGPMLLMSVGADMPTMVVHMQGRDPAVVAAMGKVAAASA